MDFEKERNVLKMFCISRSPGAAYVLGLDVVDESQVLVGSLHLGVTTTGEKGSPWQLPLETAPKHKGLHQAFTNVQLWL